MSRRYLRDNFLTSNPSLVDDFIRINTNVCCHYRTIETIECLSKLCYQQESQADKISIAKNNSRQKEEKISEKSLRYELKKRS